jgi:hypothetical protein
MRLVADQLHPFQGFPLCTSVLTFGGTVLGRYNVLLVDRLCSLLCFI